MKKTVIAFVLMLTIFRLFSVECFAEEAKQSEESFSLIGGDKLYEIIDENAIDFLNENDIDIADYSWTDKLTPGAIWKELIYIFKNGLKGPVKSFATILLIVLLTAGFSSFEPKGDAYKTIVILASLTASLIVVYEIWNCISATVSAIKYISGFMISFVPIFVLAISFSGGVVSGSGSGGLILLAANIVSYFSGEFVLPIMGGYLSLNLVSGVLPNRSLSKMAEAIKKTAIWSLSLIFTVFVGIVGIASTVNSAKDSFSLKTAKFIIGTCVPIAGGALSDSANTIYASMNVLKSSIGVYGILIVGLAVVPILVEILIWKCILSATESISLSVSQDNIASFFASLNELLSVLVAILLFSGGLFIISLSIVVSVTRL